MHLKYIKYIVYKGMAVSLKYVVIKDLFRQCPQRTRSARCRSTSKRRSHLGTYEGLSKAMLRRGSTVELN